MQTYHCEECGIQFKAEGVKKEYQDYTFGPCYKNVAECPKCGKESDEYRIPKPQKADIPSMGSSCEPGGCCCQN